MPGEAVQERAAASPPRNLCPPEQEAELVLYPAVEELLRKTGLHPRQVCARVPAQVEAAVEERAALRCADLVCLVLHPRRAGERASALCCAVLRCAHFPMLCAVLRCAAFTRHDVRAVLPLCQVDILVTNCSLFNPTPSLSGEAAPSFPRGGGLLKPRPESRPGRPGLFRVLEAGSCRGGGRSSPPAARRGCTQQSGGRPKVSKMYAVEELLAFLGPAPPTHIHTCSDIPHSPPSSLPLSPSHDHQPLQDAARHRLVPPGRHGLLGGSHRHRPRAEAPAGGRARRAGARLPRKLLGAGGLLGRPCDALPSSPLPPSGVPAPGKK